MNIGDKVALHNVLFPDHIAQKPDEFTIVTISDKRSDVPGYFGDGKYDGYRGMDGQGRMFELHWERFPDDSMTPNWLWYQVDWTKPYEDGSSMFVGEWADLTLGMLLVPKLPDYFKDKGILGYCPIHKELYYLNDKMTSGKCFHCWLYNTHPDKPDQLADTIKQIEEEQRTFKGW